MLIDGRHGRLVKIVLFWAAINLLLQTLIHFANIEYDSPSGVSIIWWATQAVALPVFLLSELSLSIGIPLSGYGAYIALTCVLAVACVGLIRVASASR
jgi:hypothetical protein